MAPIKPYKLPEDSEPTQAITVCDTCNSNISEDTTVCPNCGATVSVEWGRPHPKRPYYKGEKRKEFEPKDVYIPGTNTKLNESNKNIIHANKKCK